MADLASRDDLEGGVITAKQSRSRSTHDRIVEAGMSLVRAGQFDEVGFREIIETAGVSVGAFYGRFKNKEALLQFVLQQFFIDTERWIEKTVSNIEAKSTCLDDVIIGVVRTMIGLYQRDLGMMRSVYLRTRTRNDPEFLEKVGAFDARCYMYLDRLTLAYMDEVDHSDPKGAFRFGVKVLAAFLRDVVFFQNCPTAKISLGRNSKIEQQAAELLRRYLRGKDSL